MGREPGDVVESRLPDVGSKLDERRGRPEDMLESGDITGTDEVGVAEVSAVVFVIGVTVVTRALEELAGVRAIVVPVEAGGENRTEEEEEVK